MYFRPEAEQDIKDASAWYEKQKIHLGLEFIQEVEKLTKVISENPLMHTTIYKHLHRATVKKFPFNIFYLVEEGFIVIVAIIHGSRHPKKWKTRT
ncbi:Plasmid stabilization system protein [uncultured Candidatus Thioglobus sp.]|nr:Plasmid stabilization system protein [uncultured Candidatus Thioglobus sp.]